MASVTLGSKAVGSIVKLRENGTLVEFYVAKHNYESGLNGSGRTLLVRKDCYGLRQWSLAGIYEYTASILGNFNNGTYKNKLPTDIQLAMGTTKFYCTQRATARVITMSASVFQLSATELGCSSHSVVRNTEGSTLPIASTLKIAYYNGSACDQWTRTPNKKYNNFAWAIASSGALKNDNYYDHGGTDVVTGGNGTTTTAGSRPAFTLPATLMVSDSGEVTTNTAPSAPPSFTVPATIHGGSAVTLEWTASSDAENNLEGYTVERSLDGGSTWAQIYQGSARTATNTVAFGTETVMYRVRAYDAEGLYSGWKTSGQVAVINNTAPTPPDGITVPEAVNGGRPLTISWGASADGENNLAGYCLERQADGGEWEAVYTGPEMSFTDQVTKGWQTVAYRVRAYDTENAYSGYTAGEARAVNNNTPPEITCEYPANTSLGVKTEGFSVPYSVADEEGDPVTVTEAVDGVTMRTFAVQLGAACSFELDGEAFMRVLNGAHTLSIAAHDGVSTATYSLAFAKKVTKATVTLAQPMEADGPISVCVLSVSGSIPADAAYTVEVSNNAKDDAPAWEDCTEEVKTGANHIFTNDAAANGPAFSFRLSVERGESGQGGYINSVQGGFQ